MRKSRYPAIVPPTAAPPRVDVYFLAVRQSSPSGSRAVAVKRPRRPQSYIQATMHARDSSANKQRRFEKQVCLCDSRRRRDYDYESTRRGARAAGFSSLHSRLDDTSAPHATTKQTRAGPSRQRPSTNARTRHPDSSSPRPPRTTPHFLQHSSFLTRYQRRR